MKGFNNISQMLEHLKELISSDSEFTHPELIELFENEDTKKQIFDGFRDPKNGYSIAHLAVERGWNDVLYLLLSEGFNVDNVVNGAGETILHVACIHGNIVAAEAICSGNLNVDKKDNDGCTALHYAVEADHDDVVENLLDCGADMNMENNWGLSPVQIAQKNNLSDILEIFKESSPIGSHSGYLGDLSYRLSCMNVALLLNSAKTSKTSASQEDWSIRATSTGLSSSSISSKSPSYVSSGKSASSTTSSSTSYASSSISLSRSRITAVKDHKSLVEKSASISSSAHAGGTASADVSSDDEASLSLG